MKETRYKPDPKRPYGLHDCRMDKMELVDGDLKLYFQDEIAELWRPGFPGPDVHGYIVVERIEPECCTVLIAGKGGSMGEFHGERLTLSEFMEKYKGFEFEVINEYYGWQRLQFTGWLWMPDVHPMEMTLTLGYFKGDIVYYTEK